MRIYEMLIAKSLIDFFCLKAVPAGTKRQRKDGTYEKQSDGKWKKVTEGKKSKQFSDKLPRDLTQMTPKQNRKVVDHYKNNFSEKELNKRVEIIDQQIKRREQELESKGIDYRKNPDHGLGNLWHNRKLHETAIEEKRGEKLK